MTIYEVLNKYAEKTGRNFKNASKKKDYDQYVRLWQSYYNGTVAGINSDVGFNGETTFAITRKSMKLPKTISQKWATMLFSEQFKITLKNDTETEKLDELIKQTRFRSKLNEAATWGYAEGSSVILASADYVTNGSGGKVKLDIIKYDSIYPLEFSKDEITTIAFVKQEQVEKKTVYTISIHTKEIDGYKVENLIASVKGNQVAFEEIGEAVKTVDIYENPFYCFIRPNTVNDFTEILPFGQSIFADALAACEDFDLAAYGLRRDVKEGDQVTLIGRDLLVDKLKSDGSSKKIFDNSQGRFFAIPQELGEQGEKRLFDKIVPEIRAEQFRRVMQDSLNLACINSGLGRGTLDEQVMPTATQVIHTEAEKIANKNLHEAYLETEITKLIRAMCELSGLTDNKIDASIVNIVWQDSVIQDTESEKRLAILEVTEGLMEKAEYRNKFYGEPIEEARAKLEAMTNSGNDYSGFNLDMEGEE